MADTTNKAKIELEAEFSDSSGAKATSKAEEHFKKLLGRLTELDKQASKAKAQKSGAKDAATKALYGAEYKDLQREMDAVAREVQRARRRQEEGLDPTRPDPSGRRGRGGRPYYSPQYGMQLAGAFSPIPGSQFAMHTARAAQMAYWHEMGVAEAEQRTPNTGGALAKGALVGGGIAALAMGVLGSVIGSREQETIAYQLGKLGGPGAGRGAVDLGQGMGVLPAEAAGLARGVYRATGTGAGLGGAMFAEQAYGLGGEATGLLGGMARAGTVFKDERAKAVLQRIISTGMYQGLKQGRFNEMVEGVTSLVQSERFGVTERGLDEMLRTLSGMRGYLAGARGVQAVTSLNEAIKGQGGPVSRAIALDIAGATQGNYFQGLRRMELGMFGGQDSFRQGGIDKGRQYFNRWQQLIPNDEFRWHMIGQQTGMPANTVKALEEAIATGSESAYRKALEEGKTKQEQAFDAMIDISKGWREFDQSIKNIEKALGDILTNTGLIHQIASGINWLADFFGRGSEAGWRARGEGTPVMDATGKMAMIRDPDDAKDLQKEFTDYAWNTIPESLRFKATEQWKREVGDKYPGVIGRAKAALDNPYIEDKKRGLLTGYDVPASETEVQLKNGRIVITSTARFESDTATPDDKNAAGTSGGVPPYLKRRK